jgi:hypothetical protein
MMHAKTRQNTATAHMAAAAAPKLYQAWVAVFGSVGTSVLCAVVAKQYSVH